MMHILKKQLQYNQSPLKIATFDGCDSPYHPSVLFFEKPWNGHTFWMANSPYPHKTTPYRDRYECPSVFVSNDGFHWGIDEGQTNPIDNLTEDEIKDYDYLSDPHMLLKGDTIECWYRKTKRHGQHNYSEASHHYLLRKKSKDGVKWSETEVLMDISKVFGREIVSPSILFQEVYKMWFVDMKQSNGRYTIGYLTSEDGNSWSETTQCELEGANVYPWHIDVQFFDNYYWLTCYEKFKDLTLWRSSDGIHFKFVCKLLSPSHITSSFYSKMLYRASLIKVSSNDYRLYFSAEDAVSSHIGVMQGANPTSMYVVCVDNKPYREIRNMKDLIKIYIRDMGTSLLFRIKTRISQF